MNVRPELDVKLINLCTFRIKVRGTVSRDYGGREHLIITVEEDKQPEVLHVYEGEPATKGAGLTVD